MAGDTDSDLASDIEIWATEEAIRQHAKDIPPGVAGVCKMCEEESPRIIFKACARCRDKYRLP